MNIDMKHILFFILIISVISCVSPETDLPKSTGDSSVSDPVVENAGIFFEKNGIRVYEAVVEETFADAKIKLNSPLSPQTGKNIFEFSVENYELGSQTADATTRNCANSAKGQHIHYIMNNAPYKAYYEASFEEDVPEGTNVLLAFLSRSYHESIKTMDAHVLVKYGSGGQDLSEPLLFYSRPKGTYAGEDGKKLLLDFYLRNIDLSKTGYKVRATINGIEFILPKWCPYFVEGLPSGEHTFSIELLDMNGDPVKNSMNEAGEKIVGIYSNSGERLVNTTEG